MKLLKRFESYIVTFKDITLMIKLQNNNNKYLYLSIILFVYFLI